MFIEDVYENHILQKMREYCKALALKYFKDDDGNPFRMSDGQADIFAIVYFKLAPRVEILTSTQYGKSTVIAMAVILRSIHKKEHFVILAGKLEKAQIIMEKVIQHLFDHDHIKSQMEYDDGESIEKIKHRKNRSHITWKRGGSIRILTANTTNKKAVKEALTGHGGKNIIEEEASLIPDSYQGMVMRMLGSIEGSFLLKIGNAVYRNHFHRTWHSDKYLKVLVDFERAIQEGRYTREYIDEMREEYSEDDFNSFYACIFPPKDRYDDQGYRFTFDEDKIIQKPTVQHKGRIKLGVDVGRGGDPSCIKLRSRTASETLFREKTPDTMEFAKTVARYIRKVRKWTNLADEDVFIDDTGVGGAVTDRLHELGYNVTPINNAQNAVNKARYYNRRAENYMDLEKWLRKGGVLKTDEQTIKELAVMKHKTDTREKIIMIPKEELPWSPNDADALALTMNKSANEDEDDMDIVFVDEGEDDYDEEEYDYGDDYDEDDDD